MSNLSDVMTLPLQIPDTIPNDWSWRNLVELCNPKQWKTISSSDLTETGYRVFGANGFIGFYHKFNHEDETISVTCRGATCGTVNLIPSRTYITGNSMCLDNLSREVSKFYLFYATQFRTFSDVISGSAQPQITGEGLKKVSLPVPPLPEQKKIASILTSVDEVIENTQKQIDKLQDLKKATRNELLTKGIGHTEFKDSELGRIPKSWFNISVDEALKCKILDSIQDGNHGSQHPKSSDYVIKGIPFVMASDLRNGKVDVSRAKKIPTGVYEGLRIGFAKVGDVLLTHKATIGEVAVVDEDCGAIMCTPQVTYYRIKDAGRLSSRFLFYWFQSQQFQRELFRVSGQSTRDYIGIKAQKELFIRIPPITEQNSITSILLAVDEKVSRVKRKLAQTQALKKSLMQDLLTGKVRVTVN